MSTELKVRRLILRCFQNGFSAGHAAALVEEKFGIKGYAQRTCQRWFRKFREGDLNLFDKPTHDRKAKRKPVQNPAAAVGKFRPRPPPREVKVEKMFQQENRPHDHRTRMSAGNEVVQKLMRKNSQLTISRVNPSALSAKEAPRLMPRRINTPNGSDGTPKEGTIRVKEASKLMSKRISLPPNRMAVIRQKPPPPSSQRRSACTILQQRRQTLPSRDLTTRSESRFRDSLRTDLRLPPSIVKRMATTRFSTENHTINEAGRGAQKTGEATKKSITVQFHNVSPEVAKNTVRKSTESGHSSTNGSKKQSTQSSNPLASPKGVIYLNPQEIFGEKHAPKNSTKKAPLPMSSAAKPQRALAAKKVPATRTAPPAKPAPPPPTVTVEDSDSEDDLLFPKDVALPPPKVKAVANTFTTYWDMETDKPILLNPTKETVPTLSVIELE